MRKIKTGDDDTTIIMKLRMPSKATLNVDEGARSTRKRDERRRKKKREERTGEEPFARDSSPTTLVSSTSARLKIPLLSH